MDWPPLPDLDAEVALPAQEAWPGEPRAITVYLRYPGGRRENVIATTGLSLCLHNWGGTAFRGSPVPDPAEYDLVVIGVDYYQSGEASQGPLPYDFGYLQAADALRALYFVYSGLEDSGQNFDRGRLYAMGGSGGGNVSLMVNKLAPRTFACVVDCSGMAALTDGIAFGLAGAGRVHARYSRDPSSPAYLTPAMQDLRDTGHPGHLAYMAALGNRCKVVVIHGEDDEACLAADKHRTVDNMRAAGLDVEPHFVASPDVDGDLILDSGHSIGDRTRLMDHFAGAYLRPGRDLLRLTAPCDFDRRETLEYPVRGGVHRVSYAEGYPVLSYEGL